MDCASSTTLQLDASRSECEMEASCSATSPKAVRFVRDPVTVATIPFELDTWRNVSPFHKPNEQEHLAAFAEMKEPEINTRRSVLTPRKSGKQSAKSFDETTDVDGSHPLTQAPNSPTKSRWSTERLLMARRGLQVLNDEPRDSRKKGEVESPRSVQESHSSRRGCDQAVASPAFLPDHLAYITPGMTPSTNAPFTVPRKPLNNSTVPAAVGSLPSVACMQETPPIAMSSPPEVAKPLPQVPMAPMRNGSQRFDDILSPSQMDPSKEEKPFLSTNQFILKKAKSLLKKRKA